MSLNGLNDTEREVAKLRVGCQRSLRALPTVLPSPLIEIIGCVGLSRLDGSNPTRIAGSSVVKKRESSSAEDA